MAEVYGINTDIIMAQVWFYGQMVFWLILVGIVLVWLYMQSKYKIRAEIYRPVQGGQTVMIRDAIKIDKVSGVNVYRLRKMREDIHSLQEFGNLILIKKMFGTGYLLKLLNPIPGVYCPFEGFTYDAKGIKERYVTPDLELHFANRMERAEKIYSNQKGWHVLLPYLGIGGVIMLIIIVFYIQSEKMSELNGVWNNNLAGFLKMVRECQGSQVIPPSLPGG